MDTLMKANIFFFITSIAVVIFVILGSIIAIYVIRILGSIKRASDKLEDGVDAAFENADALSTKIRESFIFNLLFGKKAAAKRHVRKEAE